MQRYFFLFFFMISYEIKAENFTIKADAEIKCKSNEDCSIYLDDFVCREEVCKCPDSFILSSDGSECLQPAEEYGSPCKDNVQCSKVLSAGGSCIDNECKCKPGHHYLKGSCWKNRGLKETCNENEQCFATYEYRGVECKDRKCQCRKNYYERFESGCRRKRDNNESCNIDSDCPDGYTCEKMICSNTSSISSNNASLSINSYTDTVFLKTKNLNCSKGSFEKNENCVLELGMTCSTDDDCKHINKAVCLENICTCPLVTHVPKENNRECLTVARGKIQDIAKSSCKENIQCSVFGPNSFCKERKCDCNENTFFDVEAQFCWPEKRLGEKCTTNRDCNPTKKNAECKSTEEPQICVCKKGYHRVGETCFLDAWNVKDTCETDASCLFPHGYCNTTTKTCECQQNYYEEEKKCKPGVGSNCTNENDCLHLDNTFCDSTKKICRCKNNYASDPEFKYCLSGAKYNQNCSEAFQCKVHLGEFGDCVNNICKCAPNSHYSNNKCHKSKYVGEKCVTPAECIQGDEPHSILCFKGFCTCNFDFVMNEDKICVSSKSWPIAKIHPLLIISFIILFKL